MGLFSGMKEWLKKFKKTKKEDKNLEEKPLINLPKDHPDYEEHLYLKQKFGYSTKQRKQIIKAYKKQIK